MRLWEGSSEELHVLIIQFLYFVPYSGKRITLDPEELYAVTVRVVNAGKYVLYTLCGLW